MSTKDKLKNQWQNDNMIAWQDKFSKHDTNQGTKFLKTSNPSLKSFYFHPDAQQFSSLKRKFFQTFMTEKDDWQVRVWIIVLFLFLFKGGFFGY